MGARRAALTRRFSCLPPSDRLRAVLVRSALPARDTGGATCGREALGLVGADRAAPAASLRRRQIVLRNRWRHGWRDVCTASGHGDALARSGSVGGGLGWRVDIFGRHRGIWKRHYFAFFSHQ